MTPENPRSGGISPDEHGELNTTPDLYPGGAEAYYARVRELQAHYQADSRALQQLEIYGDNVDYREQIRNLAEAYRNGDTSLASQIEDWFRLNYPDL